MVPMIAEVILGCAKRSLKIEGIDAVRCPLPRAFLTSNPAPLFLASSIKGFSSDCSGLSVIIKQSAPSLRALSEGADCLMITLNPEQSDEKPLIDEAKNNGAGLLVKKALGSGHLTASIPSIFKDLFAHPSITSAIIGTIS